MGYVLQFGEIAHKRVHCYYNNNKKEEVLLEHLKTVAKEIIFKHEILLSQLLQLEGEGRGRRGGTRRVSIFNKPMESSPFSKKWAARASLCLSLPVSYHSDDAIKAIKSSLVELFVIIIIVYFYSACPTLGTL